MSLSLDDLKAEIDEYHSRIEEVLGGMDAFLAKLDRRMATVEGQMAALAEALTDCNQIALAKGVNRELSSVRRDADQLRSRK